MTGEEDLRHVRLDDPLPVRGQPGVAFRPAQAVRLVPDPDNHNGLMAVPAGNHEDTGVYVLEVLEDGLRVIIPF